MKKARLTAGVTAYATEGGRLRGGADEGRSGSGDELGGEGGEHGDIGDVMDRRLLS